MDNQKLAATEREDRKEKKKRGGGGRFDKEEKIMEKEGTRPQL